VGFRIFGFPNFRIVGLLDLWTFWFWISEYVDFWIFRFWDFPISGFLHFRILGSSSFLDFGLLVAQLVAILQLQGNKFGFVLPSPPPPQNTMLWRMGVTQKLE
jgi:hypothetical protein